MAVGCPANFAKVLLFIFNFVVWIAGCVILSIGLYFLISKDVQLFEDILTASSLNSAAVLLTIIGGFTFIIGFAGCCGAIKESSCLLGFYMFVLFILFIGQVALAIYMGTRIGDLEKSVGHEFFNLMNNYKEESSDDTEKTKSIRDVIDRAQYLTFECCGSDGPSDWLKTPWYNQSSGNYSVPKSCCKDVGYPKVNDDYKDCATNNTKNLKFQSGCRDKISLMIHNSYPLIVAVMSAIACIEVLGIFFSLCLCLQVRRREQTSRMV